MGRINKTIGQINRTIGHINEGIKHEELERNNENTMCADKYKNFECV